MRSIFEYTDYRQYLADFYQYKKQTDAGFSHRSFLAKANLKGPNFLKNVIDGKKNISRTTISAFAQALDLGKKEREYFKWLVLFNQEKNTRRKNGYFYRLAVFSRYSSVWQLQNKQFDYFSDWYNIVVREYIHSHPFRDDYAGLARAVFPRITPRQAKQAVELLKSLGMIKADEQGYWCLTQPLLTSGPEVVNLGAHNYQLAMLEISKLALNTFPPDERYFRAMSGSFSEETFHMIKLELDQTRQRIIELIRQDQNPNKIYQVNMQLYPLLSPETKRRRKSNAVTA